MRVQDAYPLFLAYGKAERCYAQETLSKFKDCFNAWLLPCLGEEELSEISRPDLLLFRSAMVDAQLGPNRQYCILMALKLFLKFCRQVLKIDCLDLTPKTLGERIRERRDQQDLSLREFAIVGAEGALKWAVMACPCRFGARIDVNLMRTRQSHWKIKLQSGTVTLWPSLWRAGGTCGCHFFIERNRVRWVSNQGDQAS